MIFKKIKWPFVLVATIFLCGAIYAIYSLVLMKKFENELHNCSDFLPITDRISKEENIEYSRLRTLCKQKDITALNTALSFSANEFEFTCQPQKNSYHRDELVTVVLYINNVSNRRLLLLEGKLDRLTSESYKTNGLLQDDYSFLSKFPATQLFIINPAATLRIPATINVDRKGTHQINISLAVPVWTSLTGNESQLQQTVVARASCQFETIRN